MEKLISMTDFVLEQGLELRNNSEYTNGKAILKSINYAQFLKQPLELWMFVPCDEDGDVLEEPTNWKQGIDFGWLDAKQYQKAKERCLFEGFEFSKCVLATDNDNFIGVTYNGTWCGGYDNFIETRLKGNKTVEGLINLNPILTATAQKQINNASIQ